jgi:signal transduction histidine kinase
MLEELGLLGAVQWLVNSFEKSVNIPILFVSDFENLPLEINKSLALYRVVQESLTNISRYAKASKVTVSFYKVKQGMLCLKVEDDGIGFDQTSVDTKLHYGILGMQERIHAIKGKMYIQAETGKGTAILVELPLV